MKFADMLRDTIEEHGERYIADMRVRRARPEIARFGRDDVDYARGPFHVLQRMTGIAEATLRAAPKPLCDLDIENIAHQLNVDAAPLLAAARDERTAEHRIADAADIIARYASYDGSHHKQWCFDHALRAMLRPEQYEAWLAEQNRDPDYAPWDTGIAP